MNEIFPLLTIIIPVYNTELFLNRCVESVINQTYDNLEVILIDDGSLDNSGRLCDELSKKDKRIKVIHKKNGGLSSARNAGLEISTGELIGFVDSDDYIDPTMFEKLYKLMVEYDADISCCNFEKRGNSGHTEYNYENINEISIFSQKESLISLLSNQRIIYAVWNKLYKRKDFWNTYRFLPLYYEDADATARCFTSANKIIYTGEPLYVYWNNETSITRQSFSIMHFDIPKSRLLLIPIYQKYCQDGVEQVKSDYITWGLRVLRQSAKYKTFQSQRINLYEEMKSFISKNPDLIYSKRDKILIILFNMGLPFFDFIVWLSSIKEKYLCRTRKAR